MEDSNMLYTYHLTSNGVTFQNIKADALDRDEYDGSYVFLEAVSYDPQSEEYEYEVVGIVVPYPGLIVTRSES